MKESFPKLETVREDWLSISGWDSIREMFFFKMTGDGTMYFAGKRSHAAYRRMSEKRSRMDLRA